MKKQAKASRMDESLGMRNGKESTKSQSYKSRRDESKGEEKAVKKHLKEDIKESKMSISKDKKLMKKVK